MIEITLSGNVRESRIIISRSTCDCGSDIIIDDKCADCWLEERGNNKLAGE